MKNLKFAGMLIALIFIIVSCSDDSEQIMNLKKQRIISRIIQEIIGFSMIFLWILKTKKKAQIIL